MAMMSGGDFLVAAGGNPGSFVAYTRTRQNLWRIIDARNLIGQAQGILMQLVRVARRETFAVLRRYSQTHRIKPAASPNPSPAPRRYPALTMPLAPGVDLI
jgi:hypothetical protein